jgi:ParB-like chromosome segregation protein Spo0J
MPDQLRIRPEIAHLAVSVDSVRPFGGNSRIHNEPEYDISLREHGQYRPIVVWQKTGEIIAGNGTYAAALRAGWEEIAATYVDCGRAQAVKINLRDNRQGDLASNDDLLLATQLRELVEMDEDLSGTGFTPEDLDALEALIAAPDQTGDDEATLAATDRAGWPEIKCQVPPELHARWLTVDGADDAGRVAAVLDLAGL